MTTLADAFAQAIKNAKKDGSWDKMCNSSEFVEKINKEYEKYVNELRDYPSKIAGS